MTEITALINQREIEMLKDFIDPESKTGVNNLHIEWGEQLYTLMKLLGEIVIQPGFDAELIKGHIPDDNT